MKADMINNKDIEGYLILLDGGIRVMAQEFATGEESYMANKITSIEYGDNSNVVFDAGLHTMIINPNTVIAIVLHFKTGVSFSVDSMPQSDTPSDLDPTNWEPLWDVQS